MKVQYKNTFGDQVAFLWYHLTRSPSVLSIALLGSGYINWQSCQRSIGKFPLVIVVITTIMMTALYFAVLFAFGFLLGVISMISKKNKTFMTDHFLELTENKIIAESRYGRSELVFDIIQKLRQTRRYILIYTAKSNAIIVPKRAFSNKEETEAFYNFLKSHCEGKKAQKEQGLN